jgi:XTP/dITP diphosphohydrolase
MQIVIATQNPGKAAELLEVIGDLPFNFVTLKDLGITSEPDETEATYEDNALLKAKHYSSLTGLPVIGEDSGIVVDALSGELGVQTRRWGKGASASDEEWIEHFLETMKNYPDFRTARFISVAVFYDPNGVTQFFRGETVGQITNELECALIPGIPISSCFRPNGSDKVYAAMTTEEKNQISHRGKAAKALADYLTNLANNV